MAENMKFIIIKYGHSLVGMIHKVGVLPVDNFQQIPFAYELYTRADDEGWQQSNAFKVAFSNNVDIEFLGVWCALVSLVMSTYQNGLSSRDTVDSVGLIPKRLPFTTSNTIVRTFRHAVALDERRAKFKVNMWNRPTVEEEQLGVQATSSKPAGGTPIPFIESLSSKRRTDASRSLPLSPNKEWEHKRQRSNFEKPDVEKQECPTDVEEVWFSVRCPGSFMIDICTQLTNICACSDRVATAVHLLPLRFSPILTPVYADVGGGSMSNVARHSLARISLRWMIRECFKTNTGIMFNSNALRSIGLDPTTLYPFVTPRPPALSVGSLTVEKLKAPSRLDWFTSRSKKYSRSTTDKEDLRTEEEEELYDALSPIYDQLCLKRSWWLLEVIPLQFRYQRGDCSWASRVGRVLYVLKMDDHPSDDLTWK
jgi:hypothetical protein